jgi:hypothetical protein
MRIKNIINNKHFIKFQLSSLIILILFFTFGCGKRRPPEPPRERVQQRAEINGFQRGNKVFISWKAPSQPVNKNSILKIKQVDVYRLVENPSDPLELTEEEFASRSTLIGSVTEDELEKNRSNVTYIDTINFSPQPIRLRYSVRYVNNAGQKAGFSNFLLFKPAFRVALPPNLQKPQVDADSIKLSWNPPNANSDGSIPANILGYNLYRVETDSKSEAQKQINQTPITDNNFSDQNFSFGNTYQYLVRAISLGTNGMPVESEDSNLVSVLAKDVFPPKPPEGITIAAVPGRLSLFFAANFEKDVAGYRIYRSKREDLPKTEWTLLTPTLLTTTTFQDGKVESGQTYYYYLTAVDINGNASEPSEIVSETVP